MLDMTLIIMFTAIEMVVQEHPYTNILITYAWISLKEIPGSGLS